MIGQLEKIHGSEEKAEDAYSFFEQNSESFIKDFGDYLDAYGKNLKSFKGRLDENGEPKLFYNETANKYYYLNKDREEIFYPLSSKGLRGVFDYKQIDKIISRLANNYFKKSKLNFNNIDFATGEKLPNLKQYISDEINSKITELQSSGIKGKLSARLLEKSLSHIDEYEEKIDALFKKMSINRVDNVEENDIVEGQYEVKDPSFVKSSFELDSKNALSSEMKIRLSLLENDQDLDPIWGENTFVPFDEVHSTLLKSLSNQVALDGEDIFDTFKSLIEKESNKKTYLKALLLNLNSKEFSNNSKNQFAKAFNLHSNNFLVTELNEKTEEDEDGNKKSKIDISVKQISESGSKKSILLSNWGSNFQKYFLNNGNKITEEAKDRLSNVISDLKDLSEKSQVKNTIPFVEKKVNEYVNILRNIGVEISEKGMFNFLDADSEYSLTVDDQVSAINSAINKTLVALKASQKKYNTASKNFINPFSNDKVFNELSKAEAYYMQEGSDASIRTGGKSKWLYSYPSYLSTKILQWKKDPSLLENLYNQSAYTKGSALAEFLLAKDLDPNFIYENGYDAEVKRLSSERIEAVQLGIFNMFQTTNGEFKNVDELAFSDYMIDSVNKVLSNSFVRTTTPADKGTDYQIKTGFFVDSFNYSENEGRIIYTDNVKKTFFNYFNSEVNRMKEASVEVDKLKNSPEKLIINYHYKSGSKVDEKDGNAFSSQYFPDISFSSESEDNNVLEIKKALYDEDGNIKHTSDINNNPELKQFIERYIDSILNEGFKNMYSKFEDENIISYDENGNVLLSKISDNVLNNYLENNNNNKEEAINAIVSDYHINGIVQNIEYSKLFSGDVAFYSDMMDYKKRVPATYTDGLQLRLQEGEEYFRVATINKVITKAPYYEELVKLVGAEDAANYNKINSADAQAWITPARWKFLTERLGKWSKDHDSVYSKMTSDKAESYTLKELKIAAQPLKGVYFYMNGKVPTFLKYSQAVLTKSLTNGNGLGTILEQMNKQGVDELITLDGFKVGSPTPTTVHNENGDVIPDITFNTKDLSNRGWKLQQDLPIKTTKQTDVGTQIQKNIYNGLIYNKDLAGFVLDGKETNGQKIVDNLVNTVGALTDQGLKDLVKEFKIGKDGSIKNAKGLYNSLISELEKRDGSKNIIDALKKETALYGIPQSIEKITNVFASIVNDRLIKIKTNGGSFIQLSNFGISKQEGNNKGVVWHPDVENNGKTYEPRKYVNESGRVRVEPAGILISASVISKYVPNWRDYDETELFVSYQGGDPIIDKRISENIIGYRIPNQGLSSNDSLKIIGLLPEENGDTVVAYTGITTKTGSDFDIDKMFLMLANFTKDKDSGRLKYTEFNPELNYEKQSKEALQNRLIELYKSVLTHPEVIKNVMKPLDIKTIEREIKYLFPANTSSSMYHFDAYNDIELRYQFLGGKMLVGMEANAMVDVNRVGSLSLNKYNIGWGYTNENDETILDKEYAEELSEEDMNYYLDNLGLKTKDERNKVKKEIYKVRLADSLTQILNGAVDIAKDPFIPRGNWTTSTTNVGNLLLRAGTHPLYTISFLAQPIIKDFISYQKSSESITNKSFGDLKDKFRRNIVLKNLKKIEEDNDFNSGTSLSTIYRKFIKTEAHSTKRLTDAKAKEFLYKVINNKSLEDEDANKILSTLLSEHNKAFSSSKIDITDKEKFPLSYFREQIIDVADGDFQLAVLDKFFELQKISKGVKENVDVAKLDTNGMGKNINSLFSIFNLKQYILDKEDKGEIGALNGFRSKFDKTQLGKYLRSMRNVLKIVRSNPMLFPQAQFDVQNMFNEVSQDMYETPLFNDELMSDLEKAYYTYTMSKFGPFNMEKEEISSILTNLPKQLSEFKDKNKDKFFILDELQINYARAEKSIFLNNRKKSSDFEQKFTDSWRDLRTANPKLAEDLIKYSFLTSGFKMHSKQFYTYIPNEYMLQEDINSYIRGLDKEDKSDFIDKFYLNNSNSYKYIKSVFADEIDGDNKTSGFTLKEAGKSRYYVRLSKAAIYKLEGYNAENKAVYTRVDKLGAEMSGITIPEYGEKFTKKKLSEIESEKEEGANIDLKYISELKSNVVTQRDKFNPDFRLYETSELDNDSNKDFEDAAEGEEIKKDEIFEDNSNKDYTIIQAEDGTFDVLHVEDGVISERINTLEEAQTDIEEDKLRRLPSKEEVSNVASMSEITNHSGGAKLSDAKWDQIGREFGVVNHNHYREPGTKTVDSLELQKAGVTATELSEEEYNEGQPKSTIAARQMGRIQQTHQVRSNYIIRNWAQVKNSEAVYAIGTIIQKGTEMEHGKIALIEQIKGGTGYAVQMAINEKKPVYVFDGTKDSWFVWNGETFEKTTTPVLTKNFAGIGSRTLSTQEVIDKSTQAIRDVYQKTKDSISNEGLITENLNEEIQSENILPKQGQFAKYNDQTYLITKENVNGTFQIYNPTLEGTSSKLSVSKDNLTILKSSAKVVNYKGSDYLVTPSNTIISTISNKQMKWDENNGDRKNILILAENGILAPEVKPVILESNKPLVNVVKESPFTPANKQQADAVTDIKNFIINGNSSEFFILEGKAGTGKTTLIEEAISDAINNGKKVIVGALSHKAKRVLSEKLNKRYKKGQISSGTIAGLLGMKLDPETQEFIKDYDNPYADDAPVESADVIIIDEASMVDEGAIWTIMDSKRRNAKVIFLGDRGQLPPIRSIQSYILLLNENKPEGYKEVVSELKSLKDQKMNGSTKMGLVHKLVSKYKFDDLISGAFESKNKASLTERVRQGEDSPILPFADYYWNNSEQEDSVVRPVPEKKMKDSLTDKGNLVFAESFDDAFDSISQVFKKAVNDKNLDAIKIVTFRNATRQNYNKKIRKEVFGDEAEKFEKGDFIMFQNAFSVSKDVAFSNSDEFSIKSVDKTEYLGYEVYNLGVDYVNDDKAKGITTEYFKVLSNKDKDRFAEDVDVRMKEAAKEKDPSQRRGKFKAAYKFKETFADVDYSYAITSHKSQGSGYGVSVVDVEDISSVTMNTSKTKSRSNYTAITRAINTALIITKGVDTSKKNIRKALNVEKKSKREGTGNPKDMGCV